MTQFVTSSRTSSNGQRSPSLQRGQSSRSDTADGLFLDDKKSVDGTNQSEATVSTNGRARSRTPEDIWDEGDDFLGPDDTQYREQTSSTKRRKVGSPVEKGTSDKNSKPMGSSTTVKAVASGPFIDESDSEDDMGAYREVEETSIVQGVTKDEHPPRDNHDPTVPSIEHAQQSPLVRDATRYANDEPVIFDDLEEDELVGDEFRERPGEADELERGTYDDVNVMIDMYDSPNFDPTTEEGVYTCPICQKTLADLNTTVGFIPILASSPYAPYADRGPGDINTCK